jgi:hypothetical protein
MAPKSAPKTPKTSAMKVKKAPVVKKSIKSAMKAGGKPSKPGPAANTKLVVAMKRARGAAAGRVDKPVGTKVARRSTYQHNSSSQCHREKHRHVLQRWCP